MTVVYRIRRSPGGVDLHGDPVDADEYSPLEEELVGAFVAPRESSDVNAVGRVGVIVGLTLFAPYGADVVHSDQIEVDGVLYDVDGDAGDWLHPFTGWEAGTVVALKRAAG